MSGWPKAEQERVLSPYAPMLLSLGQIMDEQAAQKDQTAAALNKASAEVQAVQDERDVAEAQLRLRGTPDLPRETLLDLATRA